MIILGTKALKMANEVFPKTVAELAKQISLHPQLFADNFLERLVSQVQIKNMARIEENDGGKTIGLLATSTRRLPIIRNRMDTEILRDSSFEKASDHSRVVSSSSTTRYWHGFEDKKSPADVSLRVQQTENGEIAIFFSQEVGYTPSEDAKAGYLDMYAWNSSMVLTDEQVSEVVTKIFFCIDHGLKGDEVGDILDQKLVESKAGFINEMHAYASMISEMYFGDTNSALWKEFYGGFEKYNVADKLSTEEIEERTRNIKADFTNAALVMNNIDEIIQITLEIGDQNAQDFSTALEKIKENYHRLYSINGESDGYQEFPLVTKA